MATDLQVAISQMAIQNLLFFLGLSLYDSRRTAVQQCRPEENNVRWFHWDGTHRRRSVSRISQAPISWLMAFSSTNNTITRRRWAAAVGGGMYTAGTRNTHTDPWPASKSSSVPSSFLFSSYNFGQITSFSQGRPFSVGTDGTDVFLANVSRSLRRVDLNCLSSLLAYSWPDGKEYGGVTKSVTGEGSFLNTRRPGTVLEPQPLLPLLLFMTDSDKLAVWRCSTWDPLPANEKKTKIIIFK